MTSTYVDGDMFAADARSDRSDSSAARARAGTPKAPKDSLLRPAPVYSIVAAGSARREGSIFGYDKPNARVIALSKTDGTYQAQYRLAAGAKGWADMRAMYIIPGAADAPPTLVWLSSDGVNQTILAAVPDTKPQASPSATPRPSASPVKATAKPNPKPTKKP